MSHFTAIASTFVPVASQDAALDFYCGTLGFEKRFDSPYGDGDRWVEVALPGAQSGLALVVPPEGHPIDHSVVALLSPDVRAARAELEQKGVQVGELMGGEEPVPLMFPFDDPDGNHYWVIAAP